MWKQEHISICYFESSGRDWISFHMERQWHTHSVRYFCSLTSTHIFLRGYGDNELHFEFLGKNTRTCQEPQIQFVHTAVPLCTVTELPLCCSLSFVTQKMLLTRVIPPPATALAICWNIHVQGQIWGHIHIFLICATGACPLVTNPQRPD